MELWVELRHNLLSAIFFFQVFYHYQLHLLCLILIDLQTQNSIGAEEATEKLSQIIEHIQIITFQNPFSCIPDTPVNNSTVRQDRGRLTGVFSASYVREGRQSHFSIPRPGRPWSTCQGIQSGELRIYPIHSQRSFQTSQALGPLHIRF